MHADRETEVGRQVTADLAPVRAGVIAAHDVPVLLHEQHVRPGRVHGDPVHAVTDLGLGVGDTLGMQSLVDRTPVLARVVAAERARR